MPTLSLSQIERGAGRRIEERVPEADVAVAQPVVVQFEERVSQLEAERRDHTEPDVHAPAHQVGEPCVAGWTQRHHVAEPGNIVRPCEIEGPKRTGRPVIRGRPAS